jgi:serine/threonine protein kinase
LERLYNRHATVYLIKDNKSKREMILKKYVIEKSDDGIQQDILTEVMILQNMRNHKHLIQIYNVELDDIHNKTNTINIIFEKMDGEFTKLILREPSISQIHDYMYQILNGLFTLHSHGVIHNDIKPQNIVYKKHKSSDELDIKIIDFGLAELINFPYYRARKIKTTHHFTPPEYKHYREIGKISLNSDMFSLGVIFYYLIFPDKYKQLEDSDNSYDQLYNYVFDPNVIDWSIVSRKVGKSGHDLLKGLLELNPDKRISSLQALQHAFFFPQFGRGDITTSDIITTSSDDDDDRRAWELSNLMNKDEFKNKVNQDEFLCVIVEKALNSKIKVKSLQVISFDIWYMLYEQFEKHSLKFVTLNYAIYLMLRYLSVKTFNKPFIEHLAMACLFLSIKYNEYTPDISVGDFPFEQRNNILQFEKDILKTLNWNLPFPLLATKEVVLYNNFLNIIHNKDCTTIISHLYRDYYMFELLSSTIYLCPELVSINKNDLSMAILSFKFPNIKYNQRLKDIMIIWMKKHSRKSWIFRDLLSSWKII